MPKKALIFGIKATWDKSNLPSLILANYLIKKGYDVTYVFDSMSVFHLTKWRANFFQIFQLFLKSFTSYYYFNNIKCITNFIIFPIFRKGRFYNFLTKNINMLFSSKYFTGAITEHYDFCWSSSYRNVNLFLNIRSDIKVFSIEDNPYGFGVFEDYYLDKQINLLKTSTVYMYSTSYLLIRDFFQSAKYYSNGISQYFLDYNSNLISRDNKKCIYVGAIEDWFDWDCVNYVFDSLIEDGYTLDLFGFSNSDITKKITAKNIIYHGSINNLEVPKLLSNYGTGLIPFKKNSLIKYVNPMKMYEYMSIGLRVVSSSWEELELINNKLNCVKIYENNIDFILLLKQDTTEIERKKLIEIARPLNYNNIFDKILKGIV